MEEKSIDTAVLLTVLTAAAYACAYAFESGYLAHFGLPADFVEVNLRGVLLCLFALAGTGALMVFQGIFTIIPAKLDPVVARLVYTTLLIVALVGGTLIILEPGMPTVIFAVGLVSLVIAGELLLPYLFFRRQGKTYLESMKEANADSQKTALHAMLQAAGRRWVGIIAVAILGAFVSYLAGALMAKRKTEFLVAGDCVALRVHGDLLVCAIWDRALTGEYEFRPAANARLTIERLGPMPRYTHQNLRPLSPRQNKDADVESDQPSDGLTEMPQREAQPVDGPAGKEVDASNGVDDTRNLPQPQPLQ